MLKLLAQIVATILSVGVGFLAAYIIYLFTMRSEIQSQIEKEGYIITDILEKYSSQLFYTFSDVGNKILVPYLKENPKLTELDLIDLVLKDLGNLGAQGMTEEIDKSFSKHIDDDMPYAGRIYIYSLSKYIKALFPPGMKMEGISYSYPYAYNQTEDQSKWMFPYGPNDMDQWLNEYERIRSAVNITKRMSEYYLEDIKRYSSLNQDKSYVKRNNYPLWIIECIQDVERLKVPVRRIHSLNKIIDSYTLEKGLPNRHIIVILFIMAFIFGVFLPLLIVGLEVSTKGIVPINLSLLFTNILVIFLAGFYLYNDIVPKKEKTIQTTITLSNLWAGLDAINMAVGELKVVRYDYINTLLYGAYKENTPQTYSNQLDSLTQRLYNYNNSIEGVSKLIKSKILDNDIIAGNILHEGKSSNGLWFTNILIFDDFERFFEKKRITYLIFGEDSPENILRIKVPETKEDFSKFISELGNVKLELLKNQEIVNVVEILNLTNNLQESIRE